MTIATATSVFLLGIAGSGMRGLAYLLGAHGKQVAGTDAQFSINGVDDALAAFHCVREEDAADAVTAAEIMIYSDAVPSAHPLRVLARQKKVAELSYPNAVGEITQGYTTIAIAGTHGKSSTTAFLAHILIQHGLDPSALIGAAVPGWPGGNARAGEGQYFIIEADEYREHFLALRPHHIILTTIDFDHPDYFSSSAEVEAAYEKFLRQASPAGRIVTSEATRQASQRLQWPVQTLFVDTDLVAAVAPLPGRHMEHNAALACALAEIIGIPSAVAAQHLASFPGLSRRFEKLGAYKGLQIISDYGHHPAEITATLQAARAQYPDSKLAVMVEPHTDARLQAFFDGFVGSLAASPADGTVICPTFYVKGREVAPVDGSQKLYESVQAASAKPVWHLQSYQDLPAQLDALAKQFEVVIGFSAGDLDSHLRRLV